MGTLTVSRFYVLHVFVLPALLILFIAAHVFFFRKAGAAGPIKENPVHPKLAPVPFYPRQVFIDAIFAIVAIVLIGILAIVAIKIPMDLGPRATPADTAFLPRPEWYYRPAREESVTELSGFSKGPQTSLLKRQMGGASRGRSPVPQPLRANKKRTSYRENPYPKPSSPDREPDPPPKTVA
jgi:Cytochrome b(N-terminal)/b6/petB